MCDEDRRTADCTARRGGGTNSPSRLSSSCRACAACAEGSGSMRQQNGQHTASSKVRRKAAWCTHVSARAQATILFARVHASTRYSFPPAHQGPSAGMKFQTSMNTKSSAYKYTP
ncbi:hypothetical protein DIPPA_06853 [Diplonema papillatum]|nr:hypothetical protein DIPPA_06853 [Diplonema papillatum]